MPAGPAPDTVPPAARYHSEAGVVRAHVRLRRLVVRNRHVTIPLTVPAGLLTAGTVLHAAHLGFQVLVIGAAGTVTVWVLAPHKWDRDGEIMYARYSAAAASLWLILTAYLGPDGPLEVVLGVGCAVWGGAFWWHKRPRDRRARRAHQRTVDRWNTFWQSHASVWGIGGSGVVDVAGHGPLESLLVQLRAGRQTFADVKNIVPKLESALGGYVAAGMTRPELNKANPSQVWLHLKRDDPLREEVAWDEAMLPGDITQPAPLGVRETGTWLSTVLRASFFILGRSRWGKSNELSVMLAAVTRCRNARVLLIDRKGGRAARPWLPAVDWLATTIEEARLVLGCAAAEVKARGAYAYNGEEQLTPTDEVPTLFVVIDETYEVTSYTTRGDTLCADLLAVIASQGQGLEVYTWVTSQHGSLENTVRTEQTRSNLNRRMCFQTETRDHGTFALGTTAHSMVDTTALAVKGAFYYRSDSETSPEQVRGPHMEHDLAKAIAVRNAARTGLHDRPLILYCGSEPCGFDERFTWQQIYDARWSRLPAVFHRDAPQAAGSSPAVAQPAAPATMNGGPVDDEVERQVKEINDEVDEMPDVSEADLARAAALRAARGEPPVDLAGDFDQKRRRFAALIEAAGQGGITPAQLRTGCGLGRTWIHGQLNALVAAAAVGKISDGRYAPLSDIWEAMETVRREAERLGSAAREMTGCDHDA